MKLEQLPISPIMVEEKQDYSMIFPLPPNKTLHFRIAERRGILMGIDVIVSAVCVMLSLLLWDIRAPQPITSTFLLEHSVLLGVLPLLWIVLATVNDYYNLQVTASLSRSISKIIWITLQLFLVYGVIFFLSPRDLLPRFLIVSYAISSLVALTSVRLLRLQLIRSTGSKRRLLVVGTGRPSETILDAVAEEAQGDYEVVGSVYSMDDPVTLPARTEMLGFGAEIPDIVRRYKVTEVVIAYINEMPEDIFKGVIHCYETGIPVVTMPDLFEQITGRVPIEHMAQHLWAQVLPSNGHTISYNLYLFTKRFYDIVFSLIGLTIFAVLLPFLIIAIKLDSKGPILFKQNRVGRGGRIFSLYKLRSMQRDAEKNSGPIWAEKNDPRVTRVGNILRKTRLDELPQLWNVLKGDMSIVGPRPERPEFYAMLSRQIPFYRTRLVTKPGLTGWAQIRYRYGSSVDDALKKLQYDLYYIRHKSLMLDLIIMARTVRIMMTFQGR